MRRSANGPRATPSASNIIAGRRRTTGSTSMSSGPMPGRRAERLLAALAIALALCAGRPAPAQESGLQQNGAGWGVQQLMRELGAVKRSQVRFVERKYLKILNAPLEVRGTLTYVAHDNLEKRTLSPK